MSNLKKLLQAIIGQVNNSLKKTRQELTPEEQAQVKSNLGISDKDSVVNPDWEESDSSSSAFIENRTHYKVYKSGTNLVQINDLSSVTFNENDGVYSWTSNKYELTGVVSNIGLVYYPISEAPTNLFVECYDLELSKKVGVTYTFSHRVGDESDHYNIKIPTEYFIISGEWVDDDNGVKQLKWYLTPVADPEDSFVNMCINGPGKAGGIHISSVQTFYKTIDARYLPMRYSESEDDERSQLMARVPSMDKVYDMLESEVNYENLQNKPFYFIPEHYEDILVPNYKNLDWPGYVTASSSPFTIGGIDNLDHIVRDLEVGKTYKVTVKTNTYEIVAKQGNSTYQKYLGNGSLFDDSLENTGEDFCILIYDRSAKIYYTWEGNYHDGEAGRLKVSLIVPDNLVKLDPMFLPDGIVTEDKYITDEELDNLSALLDDESEEE